MVDHYDKTFDLGKLRSVDFITVPFKGMPSMAHTMLSFGFEGDDYLAVSVEIRKEKGETVRVPQRHPATVRDHVRASATSAT